jgi:D-3-phosphoglycerate dehydrogenase / 2-oxoglutarate reductase
LTAVLKHFDGLEAMFYPAPQAAYRLVTRVCADEASLLAALRDGYEVLVADSTVALGSAVFKTGDRLKRVISTEVGPLAWIDLAAATRHRVAVAYPRTRSQNAVAEHTLALMLLLVRCLDKALALGRRGAWTRAEVEVLQGAELAGLTLGIVGWGRIARLVAEKTTALGMRVILHSPRAEADDVPYPIMGLDDLLTQADVVSLHARLRTDNRHLLGERELRRMRSGAFLINTARGALVDETALVRALQEGWIAGAALDVLSQEPPSPDHPLLHLANVLVTPHMAWNTREVQALELEDLREELRRALAGEQPLNCANPEVFNRE